MDKESSIDLITKGREAFWWEQLIAKFVQCGHVPKHISLIMDGNRRYARENDLDRRQGYILGITQLIEIVGYCELLDIEEVSLFAFSVENFKRGEEEVNQLLELFFDLFQSIIRTQTLLRRRRFRFYGNIDLLPPKLQELAHQVTQESQKCPSKRYVNFCCPYTARFDIARSVDMLTLACAQEKLNVVDIIPETVEKGMLAYASPPPEIMIRTSGEIRFSDYMLWQTNHSLLHFVSKMWPEITGLDLASSILLFQLKSNVQHFLHSFTQWNFLNFNKQEIIQKMEKFTETFEIKNRNRILDNGTRQKELPFIENH